MTNPATELAALITSMQPRPNDSVVQARAKLAEGDPNFDDLKTWRVTLAAAEHLAGVEELIESLEDAGEPVTDFRSTLHVWYQAVFEPAITWSQPSKGRQPIDELELGLLRTLGRIADLRQQVESIDPECLTKILESAAEIERTLAEADSIAPSIRSEMLRLIIRIRELADADRVDRDAVVAAGNELLGAVFVVIINPDTKPPMRDRLGKAAINLLYGVAGNFTTDGLKSLGNVATGLIRGAIGA